MNHDVNVKVDTSALDSKFQQVKKHFCENKKTYLAGVGGAAFASITCIVMRGVASQSISPGISGTASRGISVTGKKIAMTNVSLISANRQGPPSWVIRCLETGNIFTSQHAAAIEMGLPESELSKHLNGFMDHVRGNTFERICIAA
jgi:hypothetical protein